MAMTCLLILTVPYWKLEFHVHTDASNFALRDMLSQNPDKTIDKSIYYASRLMNSAEKELYNHYKRSINNDICCEKI